MAVPIQRGRGCRLLDQSSFWKLCYLCSVEMSWSRGVNGYDYPAYREWDEFYITTYHRKRRHRRHRSWSVYKPKDRNPNNKEWKFIKDVAYANESFYCAVFIVAHQQWHMMTKRTLRLASRPEQMNLVKSDEGLLLAVCYKEQGDDDEYFYHIYQFNLLRQEWTRVKSLGNRVLILRSCSLVATPAMGVISELANMIFVPDSDSDSYVAFTWKIEDE